MEATTERSAPAAHVDEQIRHLEALLVREQDEVPAGVIHDWIDHIRVRFVGARVRSYVPILVERAIRARLSALAAGRSLTGLETHGDDHGFSVAAMSLRSWSWYTARRLLAGELPRRWVHTRGVACRAEEIAPALAESDREVLVAAAWLHDIGYADALIDTGLPQLDGARYLILHGVPHRVCALVAHHSGATAVARLTGLSTALRAYEDERGAARDALWYCDATIGPDGQPVSLDERIADLRQRHEPDDPLVRALAHNHQGRAAAVYRTEIRLHHHAATPHPSL